MMIRDELNTYWQQILTIDKITDFQKHHCSQELKVFLNVDDIIRNGKVRVVK